MQEQTHAADLVEIGGRGLSLVEPYATSNWAARVLGVCQRLARAGG